MSYRVGIVGATGAVGQELIHLLLGRSFPCQEIRLLASSRSAGKTMPVGSTTTTIVEATPEAFENLDVVIFSAGGSISTALAPKAVERGCLVIDNSSAFRMDPTVPLVVPEINGEACLQHQGIIANPNCSTAIALMGLFPLHLAFGLKRFFVATYQAVSGTGAAAMLELENQIRAWVAGEPLLRSVYPHQIAFNLIPQVDKFLDHGYTREEMKMLFEGRKITGISDLKVSCTCVRVPVMRAHSMAINAEFDRPVDLEAARAAIAGFSGSELCDDPASSTYPMPLFFSGREKCGVGRLRRDAALDNGLSFWVSGDQLWKGAALNAVQIAEWMVAHGALKPRAG